MAAHTKRRAELSRYQQGGQFEHLIRAQMLKAIDLEYSLLNIKLLVMILQETFVSVTIQMDHTVGHTSLARDGEATQQVEVIPSSTFVSIAW